jgi:poly(3-hydroxybutyrate) depolymerase
LNPTKGFLLNGFAYLQYPEPNAMRLILFCLCLCTALALSAQNQCLSERYSNSPIFTDEEVVVASNVEYAVATHQLTGVEQSLKLDVWMPDPGIDPVANRPLIVMIHGGGFQSGSRNEMNFMCNEFAKRGFVAATITYRLGWGCDPNAGIFICGVCGGLNNAIRTAAYNAVQDAHAALRFLVSEQDVYGIDEQWVFVGGQSAGSITALCTTFLDQQEANAFAPNAEATSGGLFTSGNDLNVDVTIRGVVNDCGAVPNVSVLEGATIPVISFHDDGDCVVPYGSGYLLGCLGCTSFPTAHGSSLIYQSLTANGICSELNTVQLSLGHCTWPQLSLVSRASCFMKREMCGLCTSGMNVDTNAVPPCASLGIQPSISCQADFNGDGLVNVSDMLEFLNYFGNPCAP